MGVLGKYACNISGLDLIRYMENVGNVSAKRYIIIPTGEGGPPFKGGSSPRDDRNLELAKMEEWR